MQSYKDLQVWNRSMALVKDIYSLTNKFPSSERFGLTSQMQRSAVSIPSNIAEGRLRVGEKSFIQFLLIALGSCAELQTQIIITREIGYSKDLEAKKIEEEIEEIMKMISSLIKKLKANG
jgi:four helix bundle protein